MDFDTIDLEGDAERGADCHINHPQTGEPLYYNGEPITIRIKGVDSKAFRRALQNLSEKKASKTLDAAEARAVELQVACVMSWSGIMEGDQPKPCTPENVRKLLTAQRPIRSQLDEFMAERGNFVASAATNSSSGQANTPGSDKKKAAAS